MGVTITCDLSQVSTRKAVRGDDKYFWCYSEDDLKQFTKANMGYVKCRTCDRKAPQRKRSSCRDCSNKERKCRTPKCPKDHDGKSGKLCSQCRRPKCERCNTNPVSSKGKLCGTCRENKCGTSKCNNDHDGKAGKLCSK